MSEWETRKRLLVEAEALHVKMQEGIQEMERFLQSMRRRPLSRPETRVNPTGDTFKLVLCECGQPATRPMQCDVGLESEITHMCPGCASDYLESTL